ncbi:MAG: phosphoribosylglycinamide formyltransferase [Anaerolineae bacterium]|nr:phosphoribosylglycinamide formyltransferase [Anaerolineae bacterium]
MTRIAVLISGSGTNLEAILQAVKRGNLPGVEVALVVSNRGEAFGIKRAVRHGVPVIYFPLLPYTKAGHPRSEYDAALAGILQVFGVEWVVQAGWMHLWTTNFLHYFPSRVVNLHPALPGMFPGMHGIEEAHQAYQKGEIDHTGVMIHLVPDEAVDEGPVVAQETVPIYAGDSLVDLEVRVHATEHRLLVETLRKLLCA